MIPSILRSLILALLLVLAVAALGAAFIDENTLQSLPPPLQVLRSELHEQGNLVKDAAQGIFTSPLVTPSE